MWTEITGITPWLKCKTWTWKHWKAKAKETRTGRRDAKFNVDLQQNIMKNQRVLLRPRSPEWLPDYDPDGAARRKMWSGYVKILRKLLAFIDLFLVSTNDLYLPLRMVGKVSGRFTGLLQGCLASSQKARKRDEGKQRFQVFQQSLCGKVRKHVMFSWF